MTNLAFTASSYLKKFPRIHNTLRSVYCLFRPGVRYRTEKAFRSFDQISVLKIGANDGVNNDPIADLLINDTRYHGVLVEPVPEYADLLEMNYSITKRFTIDRVAVSEADGESTIYTPDYQRARDDGIRLDDWLAGCSSLDRKHLEKHLPEEHHKYIESRTVPVVSVDTLLKSNKVSRIDLIHIDTEGHDYNILRQFDLNAISTSVVLCEKKHLSKDDSVKMQTFLLKAGFVVHEDETDYLAVRAV